MPKTRTKRFLVALLRLVNVGNVKRSAVDRPHRPEVSARDLCIFWPAIAGEGDTVVNGVFKFVIAHDLL
jgi:hypothetical protein